MKTRPCSTPESDAVWPVPDLDPIPASEDDMNPKNHLFCVQGDDESFFVLAPDMAQAIDKWRKHLNEEEPELSPHEFDDEIPKGVQHIADPSEIIL